MDEKIEVNLKLVKFIYLSALTMALAMAFMALGIALALALLPKIL